MVETNFQDLELLNVQIDTWIDDEEYKQIRDHIIIDSGSEVCKSIKYFSKDSKQFSLIFKKKDPKNPDKSIEEENPEHTIQHIYSSPDKDKRDLNPEDNWKSLFFAKYLRAIIQENGTDDYTKHLDDLVIYLQRKLPYQSPQTDQKCILQHLYFQELSACGKPGLESLGFALQAYDLIKDKKDTKNDPHYSFELYKLWAKYNQGIGYVHSGQKMDAVDAFNEIIRGFREKSSCLPQLNDKEKGLWQRLLYYPAILCKAELFEDLQFSYHTVQSLTKLDGRKKESSLIKKALAYRDMGRLKDSKRKIEELLPSTSTDKIEDIFEAVKRKKKNIKSKTLGLLFDFYLTEFQEKNEKKDPDRIKALIEQFKNFKDEFIPIRIERRSYYHQVARFLKWLSDQYENEKIKDDFYRERIKELYGDLRDFLLPGKLDKKKYGIRLDDFYKYYYDRYTESMEKFYQNLTNADFYEYEEDEKYLLDELNKYEEKRSFLFKFKKLERDQRIERLNHKKDCDGKTTSNCFYQSPDNSSAFDGVLECLKKSTSSEENKSPEHGNSTDPRGSQCSDVSFGPLIANDYETIMERENSRFLDYLAYKSRHPIYYISKGKVERSFHFMGLQRWNSQTPTLTLSKGGGYLLYEQNKHGKVTLGIAIDPGFDFVDNLFHMGFTLNDIDFILLSHAHLDHIRDFEPIITSLLDLKKRKSNSRKKIHAMMTWGVYQKLEHVITNHTLREFLADTYIVDIDKDLEPEKLPESFSFTKRLVPSENKEKRFVFESITYDDRNEKYIEITPTQAYHNDYSERSDSYGYIINFYNCNNEQVFSFGYTGDTKWDEEIPELYKECDAVCIHLGALIESETPKKANFSYYNGQHCEELIEKKQHPYLFGLLRYLKKIRENDNDNNNKNKLLLISEFGEELKGGIRIDFIRRLNMLFEKERKTTEKNSVPEKAKNQSTVCLPVDIGLNVILAWHEEKKKPEPQEKWEIGPQYKVWCYGCEKFVDANKIRYRHFGHGNNDEALFCFCNVCLKSKPENAIQDRMRLICESGVKLEKADE